MLHSNTEILSFGSNTYEFLSMSKLHDRYLLFLQIHTKNITKHRDQFREEITEDKTAQVTEARLSSGTMVKSAPSLDASFLPDVTDLNISLATPSLDIAEAKVVVQVCLNCA